MINPSLNVFSPAAISPVTSGMTQPEVRAPGFPVDEEVLAQALQGESPPQSNIEQAAAIALAASPSVVGDRFTVLFSSK